MIMTMDCYPVVVKSQMASTFDKERKPQSVSQEWENMYSVDVKIYP